MSTRACKAGDAFQNEKKMENMDDDNDNVVVEDSRKVKATENDKIWKDVRLERKRPPEVIGKGKGAMQEATGLQKYDEEEKLGTPKRLITWINKVLEGGAETPCSGHSQKDIHKHLQSGVVLCRLLNKLMTDNGDQGFSFRAKAGTAFVAMENISKFNKAALVYGVPDSALFQTSDLYEGRKGPMINVINCLNTLGFLANDKGFMPDYEAIQAPKPDWAGDSD